VGKDLRTSLNVRAWVKNIAFAKEVWIDVHVFDRGTTLVKAATFGLPWEGSASGAGDVFRFEGEIYFDRHTRLGIAQAECVASPVSALLRGGGKTLHRRHSASARAD
jgi:hypothetical protein